MPRSYRKTLLPKLTEEDPRYRIAYVERASLSLKDVLLLKRAGVDWMVPEIEALSSSFLMQMKKGVLARQNLALMRYARLAQINIGWSMLLAFPTDQVEDYEQTLDLLPYLHHLHRPRESTPSRPRASALTSTIPKSTASQRSGRCRATQTAVRVMTQRPVRAITDVESWAVEKRLGVVVDDFYMPLATAGPQLLLELEATAQQERMAIAA